MDKTKSQAHKPQNRGGARAVTLMLPIAIHEQIKKLANDCKPPATQGQIVLYLLKAGITSLVTKNENAQKGLPDLESGDGI